jgi:hypothetical protein
MLGGRSKGQEVKEDGQQYGKIAVPYRPAFLSRRETSVLVTLDEGHTSREFGTSRRSSGLARLAGPAHSRTEGFWLIMWKKEQRQASDFL